MPKYEFECQSCGLTFSRVLKTQEHTIHPCPNCKADAPRLWAGFAGHSFSQGAVNNSGVHDHDYPTADKAVGRNANTRWEEYQERKKVKDKVREQGGSNGLARRNGTNFVEYEAIRPEVMTARKPFVKESLSQLKQAEKVD